MNPFGDPKSYDLRSAEEVAKEIRKQKAAAGRAKAEARFAESLKRPPGPSRANPAGPPGGQRGGGMEYAILLAAVHIAAAFALWRLSVWLEARLIDEMLETIEWIASGGFRRAITRGIERVRQ